jgi:hypothetical protein
VKDLHPRTHRGAGARWWAGIHRAPTAGPRAETPSGHASYSTERSGMCRLICVSMTHPGTHRHVCAHVHTCVHFLLSPKTPGSWQPQSGSRLSEGQAAKSGQEEPRQLPPISHFFSQNTTASHPEQKVPASRKWLHDR